MSMAAPHDGKLRQIVSPYGRLSAAICYDMDFPRLLAQAGALGADLVLSPAHDGRYSSAPYGNGQLPGY